MAASYSTALRNARLDIITSTVGNAGVFNVYDGTRPAFGGAATNLLASFTMGSPFAPAAAAGVLSPTLPSNTTGVANGTATWARLQTSGGVAVIDMDVATSGAQFNLNTTTISVGLTVSMTSASLTTGNP
jgi:hypothetical protein